MKKFLMLHGINHNMFGKRDPVQYGTITLAEIDARLQALGAEPGRTRKYEVGPVVRDLHESRTCVADPFPPSEPAQVQRRLPVKPDAGRSMHKFREANGFDPLILRNRHYPPRSADC
ncbi:3-dehydroquinate dehydratase [Burkholderia sp. OK233]|nr:3-dehydroquinate dehydratase [Burkholderia sp. OK233]